MAILQEKIGLTNEDLRKIRSMRPGTSVDLQVSSANTTKRIRTEIVGMDGTRTIIFRFPDENKWGALRDYLYTDNDVVVRYILEDETGGIIAFKVKILLVLTRPGHLIFTSFPLSIQSHDLRKEPRTQTRVPVNIMDAETEKEVCQCLVRDISLHGCRISVSKSSQQKKPELKQEIKIHFSHTEGTDLLLSGVVMNQKADEIDVYYGIKFDSSQQEVKALLDKLMLSSSK